MSDADQRIREAEALTLITNRVLMDYLSLQIDSGQASLDGVKRLIAFSANEVLRASPTYEQEVRHFEKVLVERFDQTFAGRE